MNQTDHPLDGKSYFSRLPAEALVHVVRHLSSRPRNPNWSKWLIPSDLHAVLDKEGSVAAVVRCALESSRERRTIVVGAESAEIYWRLLRVLGPVFTELAVWNAIWPKYLDELRHCFANVRCLRIGTDLVSDHLDHVLRACKLEQLELDGNVLKTEHINAVAECCAGLESLTLNCEAADGSLKTVWSTIGPTLKSLSLRRLTIENRGDEVVEDLTPGIAWRCTNLTSLEFLDLNFATLISVVLMCKRLGNQLQVLRLPKVETCFASSFCRSILASCSNVVVDIWIDSRNFKTLQAVKDRARKLFMTTIEDWNWNMLERVSRNLPCLTQLEVSVHDCARASQFFLNFFSTAKAGLRELVLRYNASVPNVEFQDMYRILSILIRTLEVLECRNVPVAHCDLQLLLEANAGLRCVKIEFADPAPVLSDGAKDYKSEIVARQRRRHEEAVVDTVNLVSCCPLLKEVMISSALLKSRSQRIADACVLLRKREIDVFVAGIQYAV